MTICIGALCSNKDGQPYKAVTVAADRMVTMGNLMEFEHDVPKILKVTDKVVILMAGDAISGSRLARGVDSAFPNVAPSVITVAEQAASLYAELRDKKIEADIFRPRGLTRQQFYEKGTAMPQQIVFGLDQEVKAANLGVEILIAGVDDSGSQLHVVGNPGGAYHDMRQIGFHAIGSGALHALQSLIGYGHTGTRPLADSVFSVYAAKRRAESAPGVGHDTDMAIITEGGLKMLTVEDMKVLDEIYTETAKPLGAVLKGKLKTLSVLQ